MNQKAGDTPSPSIAVIGVGAMGGTIARALASTGTHVTIANSRGPESLADFAGKLGKLIHPATIV